MPEVAQWARVDVAAYAGILPSGRVASVPELLAITDLTGRAGLRLNRFKVISGRMVRLRAPGEAVVDFPTAEREDLAVGSVIKFILGGSGARAGPLAAVRIVGIVASPGQFPAVGASSPGGVYVTPAFVRAHGIRPSPRDASLMIRFRHGAAGREAFLRHLRAAGLGIDIPAVQQVQTTGVQRSIRLESQALWALCVLTGLAAFAIVGQSLARQTHLGSADFPALRALGFSRVQLLSLGIARAAIIGAAAACVVVPVAVLLSPLAPVGLARIAEPDPGFAIDAVPLVAGAALVAFLAVLACAVPAWTAAQTAPARQEGLAARRGRSAASTRMLSWAWPSPAAATGVRMALQPGRGGTAVPVRPAIFGATLGVAALTASLVFAASLGHLLTTPRLSGFTWDAFVATGGGQSRAAAALRADPKIAGYTRGGFTNVRIGRLRLLALAAGGPGPTRPVITAGAAPAAGDEVALGASTLRDAHTAIGQTVHLILDKPGHPKPVRMRVVGTVIVPPTTFQAVRPGEGAAVALPGLARIDPDATRGPGGLPFLVRFVPGVSRAAGLAAVANDIKGLPDPYVIAAERPAAMTSLASIAGLPAALAGLLALIAAGTLAHTLASSTRRRRRDLAILKTLGFTRRQVRHATAWQATTIAAIALLIGLPAGIAGGRWAWRVFATQLGVLPEPVVPLTTIALAIPAALAVANLIAAAPAQAAAHTQPAAVLRSE